MNYRVLRGKNQIGGAIVEITTNKGTRIWVDFGAELSVDHDEPTDAEMIAIMVDPKTRPHAVFFTHVHGDHIGLLSSIPDGVAIYIGPIAKKMLINIRETLLHMVDLAEGKRKELQREIDLLNGKQTHEYDNKKKFEKYQDIEFTALRVDHSVFDSYMLKFKADEKVFIHTGDFRSHGRLGKTLIEDIKETLADEPVDILITEGTMMTRLHDEVMTEKEMEENAKRILKDNKYAFLICSSTNLESLSTFYWAAVNSSNKRAFYCNSYVKKQLDLYTKKIGVAENLWEFNFYRSYSIEQSLNKVLPTKKTQYQHMIDEGFIMLVGTSPYYRTLMEKFRDVNPVLIYSMWDGYLDKEKNYHKQELIDIFEGWPKHVKLHTSGHATPETIAKVITTINPIESIVPIHTESAGGFFMLDIRADLKEKIDFGFELPKQFAAKNDTRAFSSDSNMMKSLLPGGSLHAFVKLVQEKAELELCFRGNSGKQCTIYYNNNEFFQINLVHSKPRLSFNRNHARFWDRSSKGAKDGLAVLKDFEIIEKKDDKGNGEFINTGRIFSLEELKEIYDVRKMMMESYFAESDTYDFYEPSRKVAKTSWRLEKNEQQRLMSANTNRENGYYVYDMEYAQAFISKDIKDLYKKINGVKNQNKPDSLAIRYEKGNPVALVFVELKSTKAAMSGKSGAIEHMDGMRNYVSNPLNKEFIHNRLMEARDLMKCYQELGLHNYNYSSKPIEDFSSLPIELLLVITDNTKDKGDSAKAFYEQKQNEKKIHTVAKENQCGLLFLKPCEFKMKFEDVIRD